MSYEACRMAVANAAPGLSDDEVKDLFEVLDKARTRLQSERSLDLAAATRLAVNELTNEAKATRIVKARAAILDKAKRVAMQSYVDSVWSDKPADGIEAMLTASRFNRLGARDSAANAQRALHSEYLGGINYDLEAAGLKELFLSNAMELETARALRAIDTGEKITVPQEARAMAEIVRKWQEKSRLDQNAEGAWIGTLDDYIARQSHDVSQLRKAAGNTVRGGDPRHFEAWKDAITPLLDWSKTNARQFSPNDEFLREVYIGLTTGDHLKTGIDEPSGFTGTKNIARSASAERVLHFKDAESWLTYNKQFGSGDLASSVFASLDRAAHNTGLMRTWGTNPMSTLKQVSDEIALGLRGAGDVEKLSKFNERVREIGRQMSFVDGSVSVPENVMGARYSTAARTFQNITKLPLMLLSQFSDLATFATDVHYATGKSFLGGLRDAVMGLGSNMNPVERAKFMSAVSVWADGGTNDLNAKFGNMDPVTGKAAEYQEKFFSLIGARWWSTTMRRRAAEVYAHSLAQVKNVAFDALDPALKRSLNLYGMAEADWNAIRGNVQKYGDNEFAVAEGLPPETERKFRTFMADRVDYAVLQPGAKTNYYMMWGADLKRGTVAGEAIRFAMQFKSFPIAFTERVWGREVYGRGADTFGQALTNKNGELVGIAQMIAWTTALGYLSMTAKELTKGKEPRDVTDPKVAWATFMAAAAQGGGIGIYSDFLFGQANKAGPGTAAKLLGPTISDVAGMTDMFQRTIRGEQGAGEAFRFALKNAAGLHPYSSVVVNGYPRIALDYLFLYRLQEEISPGYMRRQEQRMEKENAQSFMFPPTQYAR